MELLLTIYEEYGTIGAMGVVENVTINCYYSAGYNTGLLATEIGGTVKNVSCLFL